jgi:hypothetical protein
MMYNVQTIGTPSARPSLLRIGRQIRLLVARAADKHVGL